MTTSCNIERASAEVYGNRRTRPATLLFNGYVLRADVDSATPVPALVDLDVEAVGIEQQLYRRILTTPIRPAKSTSRPHRPPDQLDLLVAVAGEPVYSAGHGGGPVTDWLVAAAGRGPSVGTMLASAGRRSSEVSADRRGGRAAAGPGLCRAATIDQRDTALPTSTYSVDVDTTVRRVIARGAPIRFIANATLAGDTVRGRSREGAGAGQSPGRHSRDSTSTG